MGIMQAACKINCVSNYLAEAQYKSPSLGLACCVLHCVCVTPYPWIKGATLIAFNSSAIIARLTMLSYHPWRWSIAHGYLLSREVVRSLACGCPCNISHARVNSSPCNKNGATTRDESNLRICLVHWVSPKAIAAAKGRPRWSLNSFHK
jgi:hypothetical protein